MEAKFCTPVAWGDRIYGLSDGVLVCLDVKTGDRLWKGGRYHFGQKSSWPAACFLIQAEDGDVFLVAPEPNSPRELGHFHRLGREDLEPSRPGRRIPFPAERPRSGLLSPADEVGQAFSIAAAIVRHGGPDPPGCRSASSSRRDG